MFKQIVFRFLANPEFKGELEMTHRGKTHTFGRPPAEGESLLVAKADMQIVDDAFFRNAALYGQTGFGRAYFLGNYETSSLKNLLLWFLQNRHLVPGFGSNKDSLSFINLASVLLRLMIRLRKNTRAGSRKNIRAHYDLSNDFYELWLDSTMTYSSAAFVDGNDLQVAQENKYRLICEKSQLKPEDEVLEIGCGWGGFAVYAAKNYGCRLTITTISDEQHAYARERIKKEGLTDQISLIKKDYRDLTGEYDKIVSIEMMEALGHEYVPVFMRKCRDLLRPNGTLCVQIITCPDEHFEDYLIQTDFIKEYIFPGGELLALKQIRQNATDLDLSEESVEHLGQSYARTLNHWSENFIAQKDRVKQLGFDEEFCRKWLYYLVSCEAGFQAKIIDDLQVVLRKNSGQELWPLTHHAT
jgi:cyclopropane-fatty-acyl-phospholipid synthase